MEELLTRLAKFALELHEDKTRQIEFSRYAIERCAELGDGKPETFDFLGFTHKCGKSRKQRRFTIHRHRIAPRIRATLPAIKESV